MKKSNRVYSRYTFEVLKLLSGQIKTKRIKANITTKELAERAGISRDLLYRIENGEPSCSIGVVFEVCSLLAIELFNDDIDILKDTNHNIQEILTLMPKRITKQKLELDDDF
ncbi:MAG: helix-turn-helix transcriptional regulator [Pseudomonadota bacterium]